MASRINVDSIKGFVSPGTNIVAGVVTASRFDGPGISTAALTIEEDGSSLGAISTLNITGAGASVTFDATGIATVTIAGGGSTTAVSDILAGSGIAVTNTGTVYTITNTGTGGTPAGSNTQIQFNDNGGFGASPNFTYSNDGLTAGYQIVFANQLDDAVISGASGTSIGSDGEGIDIRGGFSGVGGDGGQINIQGGETDTGLGGNVTISGGNASNPAGTRGEVSIYDISVASAKTSYTPTVASDLATKAYVDAQAGVATVAAGTTGNIQYNENGFFAGSNTLNFDAATSTIALGSTDGIGSVTLQLNNGIADGSYINAAGYLQLQSGTAYGVTIQAADSDPDQDSNPGGDVVIRGGNYIGINTSTQGGSIGLRAGDFGTVGLGGSIAIYAGDSQIGSEGGYVIIRPGADDNGDNNGKVFIADRGGSVILPSISDVKISGGSTGQIVQTDGSGNLSFVDNTGGGGIDTSFVDGRIALKIGSENSGVLFNPTLPNFTRFEIAYSVAFLNLELRFEGGAGSGAEYVPILQADAANLYFYDPNTDQTEVSLNSISWIDAGTGAVSAAVSVTQEELDWLLANAISVLGAQTVDTQSQAIIWDVLPTNTYSVAPSGFTFQPGPAAAIAAIASTDSVQVANYANVAGFATFAGISTYANVAGIATFAVGVTTATTSVQGGIVVGTGLTVTENGVVSTNINAVGITTRDIVVTNANGDLTSFASGQNGYVLQINRSTASGFEWVPAFTSTFDGGLQIAFEPQQQADGIFVIQRFDTVLSDSSNITYDPTLGRFYNNTTSTRTFTFQWTMGYTTTQLTPFGDPKQGPLIGFLDSNGVEYGLTSETGNNNSNSNHPAILTTSWTFTLEPGEFVYCGLYPQNVTCNSGAYVFNVPFGEGNQVSIVEHILLNDYGQYGFEYEARANGTALSPSTNTVLAFPTVDIDTISDLSYNSSTKEFVHDVAEPGYYAVDVQYSFTNLSGITTFTEIDVWFEDLNGVRYNQFGKEYVPGIQYLSTINNIFRLEQGQGFTVNGYFEGGTSCNFGGNYVGYGVTDPFVLLTGTSAKIRITQLKPTNAADYGTAIVRAGITTLTSDVETSVNYETFVNTNLSSLQREVDAEGTIFRNITNEPRTFIINFKNTIALNSVSSSLYITRVYQYMVVNDDGHHYATTGFYPTDSNNTQGTVLTSQAVITLQPGDFVRFYVNCRYTGTGTATVGGSFMGQTSGTSSELRIIDTTAVPAGGGTISGVVAGVGLTGGGVNGTVTVDVIPATSEILGGIVVGAGLTVNENGFVNVAAATTTTTGGIRVGSGLSITGSTLRTGSALTGLRSLTGVASSDLVITIPDSISPQNLALYGAAAIVPDGKGGTVLLQGGGGETDCVGGDVVIQGGAGNSGTNSSGGDVVISGGGLQGTGFRGSVEISDISLAIAVTTYSPANDKDLTTKEYVDSGLANVGYSSVAGIATYASVAGIATYSNIAGIATYATTAGIASVATYAVSAGFNTTAVDNRISLKIGVETPGTLFNPTLPNFNSLTILYSPSFLTVELTFLGNSGDGAQYVSTLQQEASNLYFFDPDTGLINVSLNGITWNDIGSGAISNNVSVTQEELDWLLANAVAFLGATNVDTGAQTINWATLPQNTVNDTNAYFEFREGPKQAIASIASTFAGISTYADVAGIATYATSAGVATISDYANASGIATYATTAGIATISGYADSAGISTYASTAGIATYSSTAGISSVTVQSNGIEAGTVSTINFADGLVATAVGGIATVSLHAPNYGAFASNTTQTNQDVTAANTISYDTTYESNKFSIVNGTRIQTDDAGTYNFQFSIQVEATAQGGDFELWFAKNGVTVDDSSSIWTLANNEKLIAALNFVITLAAGDYIELKWFSAASSIQLTHRAAQAANPGVSPARPEIPSIILSATEVH